MDLTQFIRKIELKRKDVPSFNRYPFDLPVIRTLLDIAMHPNVAYLIGENGMGKSTLLEAIAVAAGFNPEGGSANFTFSTYNTHSELERYIRVIKGVKKPKDGFYLRAII
ncbi:putative ATPase [Peribacillus cavernae]|nr:putative ATPase [Peribacillus cavernae]